MSTIFNPYSFFDHGKLTTHFDLTGPDSSPVVVLVPGATLPLAVWHSLVTPLVEAGFRVLRYDLPGRGYSSQYPGQADLNAHVQQIAELLEGLNIRQPVHIVGLALGAILAAEFAATHQGHVLSAALIAPDGLATRFTAAERLFIAPVVGDFLLPLFASRILLRRVPRYSKDPNVRELVRDLLRFALRGTHFRKALLASIRELPIHEGEVYYLRLAETQVRSWAVWGSEDHITPVVAADSIRKIFGPDTVCVLEGLGHLPFVEEPRNVASLLTTHFNRSR